jgi:hypothetical protein
MIGGGGMPAEGDRTTRVRGGLFAPARAVVGRPAVTWASPPFSLWAQTPAGGPAACGGPGRARPRAGPRPCRTGPRDEIPRDRPAPVIDLLSRGIHHHPRRRRRRGGRSPSRPRVRPVPPFPSPAPRVAGRARAQESGGARMIEAARSSHRCY